MAACFSIPAFSACLHRHDFSVTDLLSAGPRLERPDQEGLSGDEDYRTRIFTVGSPSAVLPLQVNHHEQSSLCSSQILVEREGISVLRC